MIAIIVMFVLALLWFDFLEDFFEVRKYRKYEEEKKNEK